MWAKCEGADREIMLLKNIMITYSKQGNIEHGIKTASGRVPECLQRNIFFKRRIKKIDKAEDEVLYSEMDIFH